VLRRFAAGERGSMLVIYIGSVIAVLACCELVFEFILWAAFG